MYCLQQKPPSQYRSQTLVELPKYAICIRPEKNDYPRFLYFATTLNEATHKMIDLCDQYQNHQHSLTPSTQIICHHADSLTQNRNGCYTMSCPCHAPYYVLELVRNEQLTDYET
jgi:hypothetical protein